VILQSELAFDPAVHRYSLGGIQLPHVTRVLEHAGLVDYRFLGANREVYLERGRLVHQATADYDQGCLVESSVPPEILGYLGAWRAFRRDYGFVPSLIEYRVCHRQLSYAGTLDRVGRIGDGTELLIDIKSGVAPSAVSVQLAAYAACLPHPRARLRRCVELHGDGTYRVIPYETSAYQRDFNAFLAALETFRAKEEK
jgi:hypothetical protein